MGILKIRQRMQILLQMVSLTVIYVNMKGEYFLPNSTFVPIKKGTKLDLTLITHRKEN